MTLEECYEKLGGDFHDVIGRLRKEKMVEKFALKFINDDNLELLRTSMDNKNYAEAFRAVHTIKGNCLNLGFKTLGDSSARMSDIFREGNEAIRDSSDLEAEYNAFKKDYDMTKDVLKEYKEANGIA